VSIVVQTLAQCSEAPSLSHVFNDNNNNNNNNDDNVEDEDEDVLEARRLVAECGTRVVTTTQQQQQQQQQHIDRTRFSMRAFISTLLELCATNVAVVDNVRLLLARLYGFVRAALVCCVQVRVCCSL
jgi:2C-methyl-D-erythritol 2,4-cyclodiphosphate synthase